MKLVACLSAQDQVEVRCQLDLLTDLSYDYLEFRADMFTQAWTGRSLLSAVRSIKRRITPHPLILTLRTYREGGGDPLVDEKKKTEIIRDLLAISPGDDWGPDLLDLEWSLGRDRLQDLGEAARGEKMAVISSCHRFCGSFSSREAEALYLAMVEAGSDYQKLAFQVSWPEDLEGPAQGLDRARNLRPDIRPILIGMGEAGLTSRLPGPQNPSLWTYAYIQKKSVPGQLDARTLSHLLYGRN